MKMPPVRVLPTLVFVAGLLTATKVLTLGEAALAEGNAGVPASGTIANETGATKAPAAKLQSDPIDKRSQPPRAVPIAPGASSNHSTMAASTADAEPLTRDLLARSAELDRRSAALDSEQAALTVAREEVQKRLAELEVLKANLASLEHDREARTEQDWAGLVKIYEAMRPANAAAIFDLLDTRVLIQVLDRMNDRKAAPILAAMLPERARLATQLLAQLRLKDDGVARGTVAGRS